ncbi:MAG TPA: chemotaxis protein CheB [Hyphomicrobiaceae bacterium]|nr:chemotaxis protein CheB [Hyphomicrobiaceae bacterium]
MADDNKVETTTVPRKAGTVPVAGIGASAGGVGALQTFFRTLPADTGAAYVVVVHLDPEHQSDLARILSTCTRMPVKEVAGTAPIKPNAVYVIPPNRGLVVSADQISTAAFDEPRGQRAPIDQFFRSLAEQHGDGFAVILTGAGSDGALGVKAIKEHGGLVLVQEPKEAEYASMPRAAIASGAADLVLPVREIATRMAELVRKKQQLQAEHLAGSNEDALRRILGFLRLKTGHDFTSYKRPTVVRRVARRMQVTRTETIEEYAAHLKDQPEEVQSLFADLLISVTTFFRDQDAFSALARLVIPKLFQDRDAGAGLRIWVPGCATGEEVYSIAMLLLEEATRQQTRPEIQLFASDLDTAALATAREGCYPLTISAEISEQRLQRFFTREGDHYRIKREVRDLVVFAAHSLLRDPPFSHLDLISCRNLLIYLDRDLQQQVATTFHYALHPNGYLFLGTSETIDGNMLFRSIDRETRIYQAIERPRDKLPPLPRIVTGPTLPEPLGRPAARRPGTSGDLGVHRQALEELAPPSMLIDEAHHVLTLSETAGRFLLHSGGPITSDAPDIVRPELRLDLRAGLHRAFEQNQLTLSIPVAVQFNGETRHVSLQVRPISREDATRAALVLFLEGGSVDRAIDVPPGEDTTSSMVVNQLREELLATRDHLRASRDQYEAVTEELRASNEELQSMNEEYRSTSEELETSKEELQSINEELQTLNNELKMKLESVSRAHNDLQNLMAATDVATLFLDPELRINRFTPRLAQIFNVVPGDEGRPITDFTHRLIYEELTRDARRVLADLAAVERTVKSKDERWFLLRIRPYRTLDDRIEGVVVTFVDVTDQRQMEERWQANQRLMLNELSHRFKNTHAVIQAIARQSLVDSGASDGAQQALAARLQALARSHDLLVQNEWHSIALELLAREHLAGMAARVELKGPHVELPAEIATPLGLVLHELATNASKYGALGKSGGRVRLRWEVVERGGKQELTLVWSEHGGPAVSKPARHGFGSFLVENGIAGAKVRREFQPTGLVVTIQFSLGKDGPDRGQST